MSATFLRLEDMNCIVTNILFLNYHFCNRMHFYCFSDDQNSCLWVYHSATSTIINVWFIIFITSCNDSLILTFRNFFTYSLRISQRFFPVIRLKKVIFDAIYSQKIQNITSQNNILSHGYGLFLVIIHTQYTDRKVRCC